MEKEPLKAARINFEHCLDQYVLPKPSLLGQNLDDQYLTQHRVSHPVVDGVLTFGKSRMHCWDTCLNSSDKT